MEQMDKMEPKAPTERKANRAHKVLTVRKDRKDFWALMVPRGRLATPASMVSKEIKGHRVHLEEWE
jgi:hypothetical protein